MDVTVLLVDAFTTTVGKGNRAGVVLAAEGLDARQMQAIAAYVGVSETAFVLPPDTPASSVPAGIPVGPDGADMRVRFFTPTVEVPVCGHATIATHFALAEARGITEANHAMDTGAGRMPVLIGRDAAGRVQVAMTQGEPQLGRALDVADVTAIAAALRIPVEAVRTDIPTQYVSTGSQTVILPLRDTNTLHDMQPDFGALTALAPRVGTTIYAFALADPEADYLIDGRCFAPSEGIDEDPVTGMANGPAGVYLAAHGLLPREETLSYVARQGYAMGKEGFVEVTVYRFGEAVVAAQITGLAVQAGVLQLQVAEDGTVSPADA